MVPEASQFEKSNVNSQLYIFSISLKGERGTSWPSDELVVYITYPYRCTLHRILVVLCNKIERLILWYHRHFFMNLQLLIKSNHFDKHNSFKVPTSKGLRFP